ncbi:MAG TPA: PAS domain S-box protein, partial [Candidatus Limnocylindrales bacterium]|nr:PAS domain S-box protein [Candidatus Limnocylindrales bacterium]
MSRKKDNIGDKMHDPGDQYRLLFESNPHPMWVYDLETLAFLTVNDAAVHRYGYSRDEFLGMTIKDIRPPEDIPKLIQNISKITAGLDEAGIWKHKKKDGSIIYVEIISHTIDFMGKKAEIVLANDITQRKQAQDALEESERRFRDTLENVKLLAVVLDIQGKITFCNDFLLKLTGWERNEVAGQNWFDTFVPPDNPVKKIFEESIKKDMMPPNFENEILSRNGERRLIEWTNTVLRDPEDKPIGTASIGVDITERRRSEKALKSSEEKYRDLFENANDAICIVGHDHKFKDVNKKALEMMGYSKEEILKMSILDIIPKEQIPRSHEEFEKLREKGYYEKFVGKIRKKDGCYRYVEVNSSAIIDNGKVAGSRDIIRDITERIQSEAALRNAEEKYRSIFENSIEGIYQTRLDGSILSINPEFARMLGFGSPHEFMEEVKDIGKVYAQPQQRDELIELVRKNGFVKSFEFQARCKDGREIWLSLNAHDILDPDGHLIGLEGTAFDITGRKLTQLALERSEEKYRNLIEHIQDGVFIFQDAKIQFVNEAFAKMVDYTVEEVIGMHLKNLVAPEDLEKVYENYSKRIAGEQVPKEYEFRALKKDGKTRIIVNMTVGLINYQGKVASMGTVKDITQSKKTEEKLRLFRNLIDKSNDAIFVNDLDNGLILDMNEKACINLGYTREELLKMHVFDFETKLPDHFSWRKHIEEVQKKSFLILEGRMKRKDGSIFPVETNVNIIVLESKSYIVAMVRDITERKKAQEELRKSEVRLREAQKLAHIGNWEWNIDKNELMWSDENYRIFGIPEDTSPSLDLFYDSIYPDDIDFVKNSIVDALNRKKPYDIDMHIIRPDGQKRTVHANADVDFDETGKPCRMFGTVQDNTERKLAEEELKLKAELLDQATDSIFVHDPEGNFIYMNEAAYKSRGYTREELMGMNLHDMVTPEFARNVNQRIHTALENGEVVFESANFGKNGSIIPIEV